MELSQVLSLGFYVILIVLGTIGGVFHTLTRSTAAFAIGVGILGIAVLVWLRSGHFDVALAWLLG